MTLYLISLGLAEKEDMSIKAKKIAEGCSSLYLETYTSKGASAKVLEKYFGKKVVALDRKGVEEGASKIAEEAKKKKVGLLIYGHALGATTHIAVLEECREKGVKYEVIHGSSILTAIGVTGLSLYNFGKTTSIPFENKEVEVPYDVLKRNKELHTLFLLDLQNGKYMNFREAISYLERIEKKRGEKQVTPDTYAIACGALGTKKEKIISGPIKKLKKKTIEEYPQVLIIPGKLQFFEEDFLKEFE